MTWFLLALAIVFEITGTTAIKLSDGFTRIIPSIATILCYAIAAVLMSITVRSIPVGIVYAIWSGVGIVLTALIGVLLFHQTLDAPAVLGIGLILAGVIVLNAFSNVAAH